MGKRCKMCEQVKHISHRGFCEPCLLERENIAVTLRQQGRTYREIGETLGYSKQRAEQIVKELAPQLRGNLRKVREQLS